MKKSFTAESAEIAEGEKWLLQAHMSRGARTQASAIFSARYRNALPLIWDKDTVNRALCVLAHLASRGTVNPDCLLGLVQQSGGLERQQLLRLIKNRAPNDKRAAKPRGAITTILFIMPCPEK